MKAKKVAVIVGSLRKESFNRKMANNIMKMAPGSMEMELVEIGDLPMYNQDLDEDPPKEWVSFREKLKPFDGVLFITPEYNRSVPAVLKNALDVGSRPYGQSVWDGKRGAVMSVSPGGLGGFGANHHLRQSLVFLNIPVMQQPEAYIGHVAEIFGPKGDIVKEDSLRLVQKFILAYAEWLGV